MKVITEMVLRNELKGECPPVYYVPKDKLLSPAAKEYLNQLKIKVEFGDPPAVPAPAASSNNKASAISDTPAGAKYVDEQTGAFYVKKPEYMCQLFGNRLVYKNHPRIVFRGKLDSMSATVVMVQAEIAAAGGPQKLIDDLGDINKVLNNIMYCEVMEEEMSEVKIIGLTPDELRARSHNPQKYFNIKQMLLPNYTMGVDYTRLNVLRAKVRELELAALDCFIDGKNVQQPEIIRTLNRLSSAFHIMMCMYLAGEYK